MKKLCLVLTILLLVTLSCEFTDDYFSDDEGFQQEEFVEEDSVDKEDEEGPEDDFQSELSSEEDMPTIDSAAPLLRDFVLPLPLFSPDSAWNQTTADATVLPASDQQMLSLYRIMLGDMSSLEGFDEPPVIQWPFMDINYDDYSIPIFLAGQQEMAVIICEDEGELGWAHPKFEIEELGGPVTMPAPAGLVRPAGPQNTDADAHLVLYDPARQEEWDLFYAVTSQGGQCQSEGGGLTGETVFAAGVVDKFDLRGSGANNEGFYSARAHGTPLLAGLILPEDIEAGVIAHALAFAIPGPRNTSPDPFEPLRADYFYPASTTETDFFNTDPFALAAGQRIRLKPTIVDEEGLPIDESQFSPITLIFLEALRTYGAYLVDSAGGFSFYAEDAHTASLDLTEDEVNLLIGAEPGTPLPPDRTRWMVLMEQLGEEISLIPIAYGPWEEQADPETATVSISNFEVITPASVP